MSQENKRRIWWKNEKWKIGRRMRIKNENEMVYCVILVRMELYVSRDAKSSTDRERELAKQTVKNFHFTLFQLNLRPNYLNGKEWKVFSFDEDKFKCNRQKIYINELVLKKDLAIIAEQIESMVHANANLRTANRR